MSAELVAVARALDFAARKHRDQRRKGAAAEPYVNHLTDVALRVAEATDGRDPLAVIGALLHDTIEDTETTRDELAREFGAEVADLVVELTDDKSLEKHERKRLQVEHAPHKSARARLIKIADKSSNLHSLLVSPPPGWDRARKRQYFEWAAEVVAGCRGVNARLEAQFDEAFKAGMDAL